MKFEVLIVDAAPSMMITATTAEEQVTLTELHKGLKDAQLVLLKEHREYNAFHLCSVGGDNTCGAESDDKGTMSLCISLALGSAQAVNTTQLRTIMKLSGLV